MELSFSLKELALIAGVLAIGARTIERVTNMGERLKSVNERLDRIRSSRKEDTTKIEAHNQRQDNLIMDMQKRLATLEGSR